MKLARMIALVCLSAIAALVLVGPSTAMAESTALCSVEENPCEKENQIKEIKYKANPLTVLTSLMDYVCDSSFSATVSELGEPQTLNVTEMQYTNCNQGCTRTVTELGTFKITRTEAELGEIVGSGFEVFVKCGSTINCTYTFDELKGTIEGASLTGDNGHITFKEAEFVNHSGFLCPKVAKLDALFIASKPVYVSS